MNFRLMIFFSGLVLLTGCAKNEIPSASADDAHHDLSLIDAVQSQADILRDTRPDILDYLDDPRLTSVIREYGPSVLPSRAMPYRSDVAEAQIRPWSSWWFPKKESTLFDDSGGASALTKYDQVRRRKFDDSGASGSPPARAAEYERRAHDPHAFNWEGLCDAWALASITNPEPKRPVTMIGDQGPITFSVADLKALLLKTYEAVDDQQLTYYGQKFVGDDDGWIHPDVFPEQFHRFVEVQLFQNRRAFIMDHDAGVEVWNIPVFKANYLMEETPEEPDGVLVRMWIFHADSTRSHEKDFVGTKEIVREYTYVLKGERGSNGDLTIRSGYWIKSPTGIDSRKAHPDFLVRPPDAARLARKSANPEIDIKLVDEILQRSY